MGKIDGYQTHWLELEGLVNFRDLAGLPTKGAQGRPLKVKPGRLYRSDNMHTLTEESADKLVNELGLTDLVDLRSDAEREVMGDTLLVNYPQVTIHPLSLYKEESTQGALPDDQQGISKDEVTVDDMPWGGDWGNHRAESEQHHIDFLSNYYMGYLQDRPENVLKALQTIAYSSGATNIHCAAGKDRTGTIIAVTMSLIGVPRQYIAADYAASNERVGRILHKMSLQAAYADELKNNPDEDRQSTPAQAMLDLLGHVDEKFGSVGEYASWLGWSDSDTAQLRHKLLD